MTFIFFLEISNSKEKVKQIIIWDGVSIITPKHHYGTVDRVV